jgi:hypothetical protein
MKQNFTARIRYDGRTVPATIIPQHRKDGMYYEINIPGFERFYMRWSVMDRFEVVADSSLSLPDSLVLAVSDTIEEQVSK